MEQAIRNYEIGDKLGLTSVEYRAICSLYFYGEMKIGRLALLTNLTTGATTGLVDRLERLGLVVRSRNQEDRRSIYVILENDAKDKINQLASN